MDTRRWAGAAIFVALTFVVTRFTVIPIPATKGFFNLGEVVIYVAAIIFGPKVGLLAGGIGSALADLSAAPQFAPFTLVIKGLEGYLVGRLAQNARGVPVAAMIIGGASMIAGYFAAEVLFARTLGIAPVPAAAVGLALSEVPFNVVQVAAGVVVARLVTPRLWPLVRDGSMRPA
jgi:uncharacterized membrane protein